MLDVAQYIVSSLTPNISSAIPFALKNQSVLNLAKHLKRHKTASPGALAVYVCHLRKFCEWYGAGPDSIVDEISRDGGSLKSINRFLSTLDDYIGMMQSDGMSPSSINLAVNAIKTFLRVNGVYLPPVPKPRVYIKYYDRAPTPEELSRLIDIAGLREKVMISMLALGGFRIGTLVKLKYRHVKNDLEKGIVPLHVHVEADLVKGRYSDYDTFVGEEAVRYLKLYIEERRRGTADIPPENIVDDSPLIRSKRSMKPLTEQQAYWAIHDLYRKLGIVGDKGRRRYDVRVHSLRKYFRTQLTAAGVPTEYVEYMMGHKISTYNDVKMKGVDFLRGIYKAANISIRPKTSVAKTDMLKEIIRVLGYDPEKILVKEALAEHRTVLGEDDHLSGLRKLLKELLLKEMSTEFNNGGGL